MSMDEWLSGVRILTVVIGDCYTYRYKGRTYFGMWDALKPCRLAIVDDKMVRL